jgi:CRP-like cAMP-binding protein
LAEPLTPIDLDPAELVEVTPEADFDAPTAPHPKPARALAAEAGPIDLELIDPPASKPVLIPPPPPPAPAAVEVHLDDPGTPKPKTGPQPIGDLLADSSGGEEEEVELLSISSDEPAPAPPPQPKPPAIDASIEDLDKAFGAIVEEHDKPPRKVPRVPLFSDLTQEALVELVKKLDYRGYQPGEIILREGEPGRSFYVISEGRVRVYKKLPDGKELELARLEEGAFFGEMAMLSGAPRTATIAAETETHLLEVTDKVVRQLALKYPSVVGTLKNFYRQRLLNNVMAISPLFRVFDQAERVTLMTRFAMQKAALGEVLVEQGTRSDGLYVVLHGLVSVTAKAPGGAADIATLREGDIFGEMSLLTKQPAVATVKAVVPSIVLKLPREKFQEMIQTHPQILELVSELTDKRRSATEAILKGLGPGLDGMAYV